MYFLTYPWDWDSSSEGRVQGDSSPAKHSDTHQSSSLLWNWLHDILEVQPVKKQLHLIVCCMTEWIAWSTKLNC